MNKKMSKRERDIKSKLMAAIAMLLVSSIMMVSTTYAWFTLSTAPEVTGITTSVGANGNLEMALIPADADLSQLDAKITSNVGDSMTDANVATSNITWGNLVDLSDSTIYGLDKIQLYPAALDAAADEDNEYIPGKLTNILGPLQTPQYGADGRVSQLVNNTVLSRYDSVDGFTTGESSEGYGVRAVGSASGMTTRQLEYRNANAAATSAINSAISAARSSLKDNGGALSGMAMAKVAGTTTYTLDDVNTLLAMVNGLVGGVDDAGKSDIAVDGAMEYIQKAYNQYFLAIGASAKAQEIEKQMTEDAGNTDNINYADTLYRAIKTKVEDTTKSQADILDELMTEYADDFTELSAISANVENLKTITTKAEAVRAELTELAASGSTEFGWSDLSGPLTDLVNIDELTINDVPVREAQDRIQEIVSGMSNGLVLSMPTGGGIYADIADYCGDYTVGIKLQGEVKGIDVTGMDATMATKTSVSITYMKAMGAVVSGLGAPSSEGSSEVQALSEMYGYVIDLAFRTNAASSNLLLQTEATGRIYSDDQSAPETMGHGSTMTFTGTDGFPAAKVAELMKHIRIVFFDPANGDIYGTAKLNMDEDMYETADDGLTVTAKINMYTVGTGSSTTTYVEKTDGVEGTAEYVSNGKGGYRKAGEAEYIADADVDGGYRLAGEAEVATHVYNGTAYVEVDPAEAATHVAVTTTIPAGTESWLVNSTTSNVNDAVITPLTQNQAQAVSVLVYLNGQTITNKDVAYGASSATGTMNLQFSSSATLVPMNYAALMEADAADTTATTTATTTAASEPTP